MQFSIINRFKNDGTLALQFMLLLRQLSLISVAVLLSNCFNINVIGQIEGLQYLIMTFTTFWVNGLLQWFLPTFQNTPQAERDAFLGRVFFVFIGLSFFVCSAILANQNIIFDFFLKKAPYPATNIFLAYALIFLPTYFLEYVFFVKNKFSKILLFSVLSFLLQNIAVLFAWYFERNIEAIFAFWLVLATLRFIALAIEINPFEHYNTIFDAQKFNIFKAVLPLIVYTFLAQWAITFDGWLVNWKYAGDATQFAIFRYGAREFPIVLALATGLSNAMSATIATSFDSGLKILKIKSLRLMHLLFPATILLLASSQYWFTLIFSKAFSESVVIFDVFLLLIISRLLFPQSVALARGEQKAMMWIGVIELFINIVASFILAAYFGLAGIAFGTWIAALSEKILIALWLFYKHKISFSSYTPLKMYFLYSIILLICFILKCA